MPLSRYCGFTCKIQILKHNYNLFCKYAYIKMMVLMKRGAIETELGSGQGDVMTRIPNSNHTWSSGIGSDVAFVIWYWFWCCIDTRQFPSIPGIVVLIFIPKHQVVVY